MQENDRFSTENAEFLKKNDGVMLDFSDGSDELEEIINNPVAEAETLKKEENSANANHPSQGEAEAFTFEIADEDIPRVRSTYVPRFTEVSENYRMQNSDAPHRARKISADKYSESVDPTAEIYENKEVEGVVVNLNAPALEVEEMPSTVFKFEVADDHLPRNSSPIPEETKEELPPEVKEIVSAEPESEPDIKREYSIPDPELGAGEALPVKSAPTSISEAPETVGDASKNNGKSGFFEYTSYNQRDSFKDKFLDSLMSHKVRLFASVGILILALLLENIWILGIDLPGWLGLSMIPGIMAILDAQLVIALFLFAIPEVLKAFRYLIVGKAVPELFIPINAVVIIFYYVSVVFDTPLPGARYPLFGLLFAVLTVGAILSSLFKRIADFSNFKIISLNTEKQIVDRKLTRLLPEENLALDGKIEAYKSKTARVFRASFISDFFKRSKKCSENSGNVLVIIAATFGIAFVSAAVSYFLLDGFVDAVTTFASIFIFGVPVLCVLSHKVPFFHSVKEATLENSAIIGESSLFDYSGVDVLTFFDTEIFGEEDITLQRIMLYGKSENLSKAMQEMAALFSVVGGPLKPLFTASLENKVLSATKVSIESDGIVCEVGGREVRAGSLEYMVRNGISIPEDNSKDSPQSMRSTKIMYAAESGEVYAKFYIRYTLSEEFTMLLPSLLDEGITPLVYTRDPNVNNDLFFALTAGSDSIRVLKKLNLPGGDGKLYNRVSAGLVTVGDKSNVINMILLSKKYVRFQARMSITELLSMVVGAGLSVVLSLFGMFAVPSLLLAVWQVAWCTALILMSKRSFNPTKNKSKTRD